MIFLFTENIIINMANEEEQDSKKPEEVKKEKKPGLVRKVAPYAAALTAGLAGAYFLYPLVIGPARTLYGGLQTIYKLYRFLNPIPTSPPWDKGLRLGGGGGRAGAG